MELTKTNAALSKSKGYESTEVGLIPEDWELRTLGEISKINMGQSPSSSNYNLQGVGLPLIQGNADVKNRKTIIRNFTSEITKKANAGEIIMSVRAPVGEVSRTEFDCCIGRGVCSISYKNNYLYHYLIFFEKSWGQFSTGSTFDSVNSNQVKSILVPLPPSLTEQKAIATALSDVDDFISNLDKLIAKKKDIKKGAMQQLLTPPNKGGIRLPGFSGEWEVKRLGDIAEFLKGKGLPKSELVQDGTNKCIHYGELFTKYSEVIITVQSSTNSNVNSFFSVFNDVLMPTSDVTPNGLATASAIFEDEILLGGDILVIRTNPKELNGAFLAYQVSVNRPQIMSLVSGTTVYHLYGSDMAEFIFSAPKPDEQNAIVEILEDMKNEINSLEKTRQKYNELKQGMMQQLLTGKTRLV